MTPVKVILANDVEVIVEGLKALLAPYRDRVEVVGLASGEPEIVAEALTAATPDILLIDTFSRSHAGLDAARWVLAQRPPCAVVIFTETDDLDHLFQALRLGVRGYLLKEVETASFVSALERIAAGETVVDGRLGTQAALLAATTTAHRDWEGAHLGLSRREAQVLRLLAAGQSLEQIGSALSVGRETVRTHVRQIYRKLGVNARGAAVAIAWREGLGS